ncbi:3,4-dihydroxy-2-butanone-4-phosphate synthase [Klenkia brasiliensis]|uniref:3,4-dihydroxy-2-butanone-4-phosphate synthase n=1 Tax=Klenkia brasiliensis TaxID=333142 RepID=A0A1G7S7Q2_9ACTN|nr:3,4-dihydroxy-2-butanone-4-phosphate synthase [Klenkia brasiliensis]SDG19056.1 3,4-dihydroxy 2-butanone 4-phosphate synthase / GTP cyclohydrolase II [Klenkia brasiliensis]
MSNRAAAAGRALGAGAAVVLEDPDGDGYLVARAEHIDPHLVSFAIRYSSGFVCVALTGEDCERLDLPAVARDEDRGAPDFRVTVDRTAEGTGISAADRARTIAALADADAVAGDFTRPGHVVPVRAVPGGVLARAGAAEAAVDLVGLGGGRPAALLCAVVSPSEPTRMATGAELASFAVEHGLVHVTIPDLMEHLLREGPVVRRVRDERLPTDHGVFRVVSYRSPTGGDEQVAFVLGEPHLSARGPVEVHVHTPCAVHDVGARRTCPCARVLDDALASVRRRGGGVVVSGRPGGLLTAWGMGEWSRPAPSTADVVVAVLADLGIARVELASAEPGVRIALDAAGCLPTPHPQPTGLVG